MKVSQLEEARYLIDSGADVNVVTSYNNSAMHYHACNPDILKLLIDSGATVDIVNHLGETPFLMISKNKNLKVEKVQVLLDLLVDNGADIHKLNNSGKNTIELATNQKNYEVVLALLKYPIDQNITPYEDTRNFLFEVQSDSYFKRFVKAGADIHAQHPKTNETILFRTIYDGKCQLTSFLIKAGADINHQNYLDYTPIILAASLGHNKQVELLINAGADLMISDINGKTVLDKVGDEKLMALIEKKMLEDELNLEEMDCPGL